MANHTQVSYVKKAQMDYPDDGIEAGESYYWFGFNGKRVRSKTRPTPREIREYRQENSKRNL